MISALIFAGHLVFLIIIITKFWQNESASSALINAVLIIVLFSVGWSITTMVMKLIIGPQGFGLYFNRDDMSLTLLSIGEFFFYKMYYGDKFSIEDDKEK